MLFHNGWRTIIGNFIVLKWLQILTVLKDGFRLLMLAVGGEFESCCQLIMSVIGEKLHV